MGGTLVASILANWTGNHVQLDPLRSATISGQTRTKTWGQAGIDIAQAHPNMYRASKTWPSPKHRQYKPSPKWAFLQTGLGFPEPKLRLHVKILTGASVTIY